MEVSCVNRKIEAVAAHGSNSNSRLRGSRGVADLTGLAPEDEERCLANCPTDMAKASQWTALTQSVDNVSVITLEAPMTLDSIASRDAICDVLRRTSITSIND